MTLQDLGSLGEFVAAVATVATLVYLAVQIRQNTAQQRREELVSVQHGQNSVLALMQDADLMEAYVRVAAERDPSARDVARAHNYVIQYLNHFQIVHDLHVSGALEDERYDLWAGFVVAQVAPPGIRRWWDDEGGKFAFHAGVRQMVDARLADTGNPPRPITEMWTMCSPEAWEPEFAKRDAGRAD